MPPTTKRATAKPAPAQKAPASRVPRATRTTTRGAAPTQPATPHRRGGSASPRLTAATHDEAETAVEASSGNVFADLGFADAGDRLAKAQLARIVRQEVRARMAREGWTQARAAKLLGITAPDMSDLMRGKLARFGQERLEAFLTRLDFEVRIQVGPRPAEKVRAEVTVERVAAFA